MSVRKLKFPLTLTQGTGVSISNTGVDFDGTTPFTYEIGVGNDISTTGKPQFSAVTSSTVLLGSTTIRNYGLDPNFSFSGAVTVDGDFNIEGNATVLGRVTAEEFIAELSSSSTLFKSGSTEFGEDLSDNHYMTGSIYLEMIKKMLITIYFIIYKILISKNLEDMVRAIYYLILIIVSKTYSI